MELRAHQFGVLMSSTVSPSTILLGSDHTMGEVLLCSSKEPSRDHPIALEPVCLQVLHGLNSFKSTQIRTSPDLLGTITIPAHYCVDLSTLEITPAVSICFSSSWTLLLSGIATCLQGV